MTILIIDSDAYLAGIYGRRFEMANWQVLVAENSIEAKKLFKKEPDVVLIDVEVISDGIQLIDEFRKKKSEVKILALTKLGDAQQIHLAQEAGANAYLLKGHFVPSEVIAKVERLASSE